MNKLILAIAIVLCATCVTNAAITTWGYIDRAVTDMVTPERWFEYSASCGGEKQSPIHIHHKKTKFDSRLNTITIRERASGGSTSDPAKWNVRSNRYTVEMTPVASNKEYTIYLRPERQRYKLNRINWHWGGSEHLLDGHLYAAEAQLTFESMADNTKLVIISFLFEYSQSDWTRLDRLVKFIENTASADFLGTPGPVFVFKLRSIFPRKIKKYYRYTGSLTSPTGTSNACTEEIKWIIAKSPIRKISQSQIIAFQTLMPAAAPPYDNKRILTNSRPVQKLNGRKVRRNF